MRDSVEDYGWEGEDRFKWEREVGSLGQGVVWPNDGLGSRYPLWHLYLFFDWALCSVTLTGILIVKLTKEIELRLND